MALIGESGISGCLGWRNVGRKQMSCSIQPCCDTICVRRQTDQSTKAANEPYPRCSGTPRDRADFTIRPCHECREWLSLPTASPGVCRRNLLRRPSGEPVSIPPLTPLQPARRGKDVQPARDRQISHRAHIQVHADCVDAVQAQRFMRYCWADHHGLSGVRCDRSNRSGKSLYACQYNGDLNLVMEMSRQRRAHITAPNGLLDAAPIVATGIRPYVCDWHTALFRDGASFPKLISKFMPYAILHVS